MRKVSTFLGATLALALVVPASAQAPDMFKDLDTNHWAYQAVENLRAKNIVWGYPDGYFRGKRTLTRYEFAVALERALKTIPSPADGKQGERGADGAAGKQGETGPQGPAGAAGSNGMTPDEVTALRKLTQEFKDELASLGQGQQAINRKLGAIEQRIGKIEELLSKQPKITGGAYVGIRSDRSDGGYVDYNGVTQGIGPTGGSAGLVSTPVVVHQYVLGVMANIAGGGTIDAAISAGNFREFEGGNLAQRGNYVTTPTSDTYIHRMEISTPFGGLGRSSKATFGRFGHSTGRFTLQKPDMDRYFSNPFEDDGKYYMDGLKVETNFGSVSAVLFGGQTKNVNDHDGHAVNSPLAGAATGHAGDHLFTAGGGGTLLKPQAQPGQGQMTVDQLVGVTLGLGLNVMQGGHVRFTAIDASAEQAASFGTGFNNTLMLGADLDLKVAERISLTGNWGKTITGTGRANTVGAHQNNAIDGKLAWTSGAGSVSAGYRYVDPLFYAPGYWGRIGNWLNPTNIQGPTVRAGYDFSPSFGVTVGGESYSAARNLAGAEGGLSKEDRINRILAGVKWDVAKNFQTTIDWEGVFWSLKGQHAGVTPGGSGTVNPTEHYITLGTGYNLTSTTKLKLNYTIGDFNGHGYLNTPAGGRYNFNTFTGQVAVKF